jgi:hypothetical protein
MTQLKAFAVVTTKSVYAANDDTNIRGPSNVCYIGDK